MREIKFRAWQKNHKKLSRISHVSFDNNNEIKSVCFDNTNNGMYSVIPTFNWYYKDKEEWNLDCLEIEQYTGLTDKNGVEIYEGDMVSAGNKKWIVIWHEQQSCWWLGPIVPDNTSIDEYLLTILGNGMLGNGYYTRKDLEVIGNIHQNKDLLK